MGSANEGKWMWTEITRGARGLTGVAAALLLVATVATAGHHEQGEASTASGHAHDAGVTQMISAVVGGKNVFIPSTVVIVAGKPHTLSIFNTTDKPHGFRIPDLGIEAILNHGAETLVELPALPGSKIHSIVCHLHPPHRTATLVVLDVDDD